MELAPHGGATISRLGETREWGSIYAVMGKPSSLLDEVSKGNPHRNSVSNPKIVETLEGGKMFMTPSGKNFRNNMHKIKL